MSPLTRGLPDDDLSRGPVKTFFRVVVPISGTVYATVLIPNFVAHFGSKPINYGPIMASLTISDIPMLLMFVFLQKYYVEGIASTGIKG